jgi:hypothetical protein
MTTDTQTLPNGTAVTVSNLMGSERGEVMGTNRDPQSGVRYYSIRHADGTWMTYPESQVRCA